MAIFVAVSTSLVGADLRAQPCPENQNKDYVTHIGRIREDIVLLLNVDGQVERLPLEVLGEPASALRHFRVRVNAYGQQPKDWRLTFYDESIQHALQIMGPDEFKKGATLWSRRFEGGEGKAILDTRGRNVAPFVKINGAIVVSKKAKVAYYSVRNVEDPKWQCLICPWLQEHKEVCANPPIKCTASPIKARRWGESVGMMMAFNASQAWTCSGFLISRDLFLTNWHCGGVGPNADPYWDNDMLRNLIIDFSWDGDDLSNEYGWSGSPVTTGENVVRDKDLDFAVFRVKPLLQSFGRPPIARIRANPDIVKGKKIQVIHHPLARVKHLTQADCEVDGANYPSWFEKKPGVDFLHQCDTEGGSSGAPVLDEEGYVIGVHHSGYTMDETGVCDGKNKAVKIDRILGALPAQIREEISNWQQ